MLLLLFLYLQQLSHSGTTSSLIQLIRKGYAAENQDKEFGSTCYFRGHPLSKHTKCIYAHRRKMQRVATLLNFVVFACSLEFKTQVDV